MSYWYLNGADGQRYCWARNPSFTCPHTRSLWDYTDLETGETRTVEREPGERMGVTFKRHVPEVVELAAVPLAMDPEMLASIVVRAHRHDYGRRRVNGKLTDQCKVCGARMERHGFRCWIERDATADEFGTGDRITEAMGGTPTRTVKSFYMDTKREAQAWARDQVKLSKAIKEEQDAATR